MLFEPGLELLARVRAVGNGKHLRFWVIHASGQLEPVEHEHGFNGGVTHSLVAVNEGMILINEKPSADAFATRDG